ncbi:MAG: glycoside hydrolase family 13 protein [Oscillospiraceae bacterium]|nr:glycoside hydrolase family 13 protein [Oscillospiraceae bacterium]
MYIFDENDIFHRSPYGAVETPGTLTLQIKLMRGMASNPRVCLYPDGGDKREISMGYDHALGSYDVYKAIISFDLPGLFWYHFLISSSNNTTFSVPELAGSSFQITVYKPESDNPDWIHGGVIYHIFVDRFASDGNPKLAPGAVHRADWGGCPYFLPDERGIVKNNDFFGGNLYGVIEKLPYLEELGVTCIYLSPVFEADSNHKYDTSDFMKVDEAFGGDEALEKLCKKAGKIGIKVILDGVFNHVGSDSLYFNRYGRYDSLGAYQDRHHSPYKDWFTFRDDGTYDAWWGIELLPAVNSNAESYKNFLCNKDGVIAHWMKRGVAGWRLDVVDEIPDVLLDPLCAAMRREDKNVFITGEVWEDASHKIAYSVRRRYFQGGQLHSVTNYPLKDAIICYLIDGDINKLTTTMASLCRNYPENVLNSLMNIIGTHDTMRILTVLSGAHTPDNKPAMSHFKLNDEQISLGKKRLRLAAALQFTLPGVPCVYYGDEAGMEGCIDPFNRICYPWGHEDLELISWYKQLSKIRKENSAFKDGPYTLIEARDGLFAFTRGIGKERVLIAVNASDFDKTINASDFCYDLLQDNNADTQGKNMLEIKASEVGIFRC